MTTSSIRVVFGGPGHHHCGGSASDATALSAADTDRAAFSNDGHLTATSRPVVGLERERSRRPSVARGTSLAEDLLSSLVSSLTYFASAVRGHPLPAPSAYCTVAHADTRALPLLCPSARCTHADGVPARLSLSRTAHGAPRKGRHLSRRPEQPAQKRRHAYVHHLLSSITP